MQIPLDSIAGVIEQEEDRLHAVGHHDGQFLNGQLAVRCSSVIFTWTL